MSIHDWRATILHLLGLDHERLTFNYAGRDFRLTEVSGVVEREISRSPSGGRTISFRARLSLLADGQHHQPGVDRQTADGSFLISAWELQDGRDLNGDGDLDDYLLHVAE